MKKQAYIYPITARLKTGLDNPYLNDFMDALSNKFEFVNKPFPSNSGILNILKFINKLEFVFLNWIEDLPDKKLGKIQSFILKYIFIYLKLKRTKIVWTIHNRFTHYKQNERSKKKLVKLLAKYSDFILTHGSNGVEYAQELNAKGQIIQIHHPVKNFKPIQSKTKEIDILIWGTIAPYKCIDQFLKFLYDQKSENKFKILVTGKILNADYEKEILRFENNNIKIINKFLDFEEIKRHIENSKVVLFTYQSDSIISSGALMDTLGCQANIVGPAVGAFKDLANDKIVGIYQDFEELMVILEHYINMESPRDQQKISNFIEENSWEKFSIKFESFILKK